MMDLTLKCNHFFLKVKLHHEDLMRGFEAEVFSGSVIETVNGEGDIFRRDGIEVHLSWSIAHSTTPKVMCPKSPTSHLSASPLCGARGQRCHHLRDRIHGP